MSLPKRRTRPKMGVRPDAWIRSEGHKQWVRGFPCCLEGKPGHICSGPVQTAHVRSGTDGGEAVKPSDCWVIPFCAIGAHHHQHQKGEAEIERQFNFSMKADALEYWRRSRHRQKFADHPANPLRTSGAA